MTLHCPATLLVGLPEVVALLDEPGLVMGYGPYASREIDVVEELAALADLHRGERVVVPIDREGLDQAAERVGRAGGPQPGEVLRVEVGDDGWVVTGRG